MTSKLFAGGTILTSSWQSMLQSVRSMLPLTEVIQLIETDDYDVHKLPDEAVFYTPSNVILVQRIWDKESILKDYENNSKGLSLSPAQLEKVAADDSQLFFSATLIRRFPKLDQGLILNEGAMALVEGTAVVRNFAGRERAVVFAEQPELPEPCEHSLWVSGKSIAEPRQKVFIEMLRKYIRGAIYSSHTIEELEQPLDRDLYIVKKGEMLVSVISNDARGIGEFMDVNGNRVQLMRIVLDEKVVKALARAVSSKKINMAEFLNLHDRN